MLLRLDGYFFNVSGTTFNKLRTVVRQTELAAYAAFRDADGNVTRGDMILGLNRLSSLMWIFMIKLKAGRYERK